MLFLLGFNMKFTIFFFSFMVLMSAQRVWETFLRKGKKEKGQIIHQWTLFALSAAHIAIGVLTVIEYCIVDRTINYAITLLGVIVYFFSFFLRKWAIKTLGEFHSINIEIKEYHLIIKEGPYKYLRHPYYFSVMLELLGFPLVPNAYFSFCCSVFVYIPLVLVRLYLEEKAMIKKFGDEYLKYKRETKGLLPF